MHYTLKTASNRDFPPCKRGQRTTHNKQNKKRKVFPPADSENQKKRLHFFSHFLLCLFFKVRDFLVWAGQRTFWSSFWAPKTESKQRFFVQLPSILHAGKHVPPCKQGLHGEACFAPCKRTSPQRQRVTETFHHVKKEPATIHKTFTCRIARSTM